MELFILLTNVSIRKRKGMKKMIQIEKKTYKGKRTKMNFFKKSFCTKEDNTSSDEDEVSESDIERVIFMEV
jgi:hypothetical protein